MTNAYAKRFWRKYLRLVRLGREGSPVEDPLIDFMKTSRAVIYAPPDMDWSLDGERQPGCERAGIENLHGAIRLIVND